MTIKPALSYSMSDSMKALAIYYTVIIAINGIMIILLRLFSSDGSFSGLNLSTFIFNFILGLSTFRQTLLMLMQHGRSRHTVYLATAITATTLAVIMSSVDMILTVLLNMTDKFFSLTVDGTAVTGLISGSGIFMYFNTMITYLLCGLAGFIISAVYYRMNTFQKIIVSAGVPLTILVVLPLVDSLLKTNIFISLAKIAALVLLGDSYYLPAIDSEIVVTLIRLGSILNVFAIYYLSIYKIKVKA